VNTYFSIDCRGCTDCFGCVGLRKKQYYWFNERLEKHEFEKRVKGAAWDNEFIKTAREEVRKLRLSLPVKNYHGTRVHDSTGDYIENCEQARVVFNCRDNKETAYMQDAWEGTEDCLDNTEIIKGQLSYEIQGVETPHRTIVARSCFGSIVDSCYCDMCFGVRNCFGCFGLKSKEYCILNKQYGKEDYLKLKEQIIAHMRKTGEWGEYFPPSVSPFAYNESMAEDYFPLSREEAIKKGYSWRDRPKTQYEITLTPDNLPKTISETKDDILNQTIRCKTEESAESQAKYPLCTGAFRLVPLELLLLRKLGIPAPEYCYPCRRSKRFALRNPRRLSPGVCQCKGAEGENANSGMKYINTVSHFHGAGACPNKFQTSYTPDRPEIVYCEECYQAEVA
jgi:hypothetical protein